MGTSRLAGWHPVWLGEVRPRGESLGAQRLERGSKVDGTYICGHPSEKRPHHKRDHRMADSKQDDTLIVQRHSSIPFTSRLFSFWFRDETTSLKNILFQR